MLSTELSRHPIPNSHALKKKVLSDMVIVVVHHTGDPGKNPVTPEDFISKELL